MPVRCGLAPLSFLIMFATCSTVASARFSRNGAKQTSPQVSTQLPSSSNRRNGRRFACSASSSDKPDENAPSTSGDGDELAAILKVEINAREKLILAVENEKDRLREVVEKASLRAQTRAVPCCRRLSRPV